MGIIFTFLSIALSMTIVDFLHSYGIDIKASEFMILILITYSMLNEIPIADIVKIINNFKYRVAFKWTN